MARLHVTHAWSRTLFGGTQYNPPSRFLDEIPAELVAERLAPLLARGTPVLLLGDLNARLGAPTVDILAEAGLTFADVPGATFHFNRGINVFGAIDHVALGPGIALEGGPWVLRERFAGDWPSDHYPVAADITLSGPDQPAGAGGIE